MAHHPLAEKAFCLLRLDAPADFDYGNVRSGDVALLTAAISAPDICAREHDRAWAVNVTGTSSFIQSVIDRGARVLFFSSDTVYGEREDSFDESAACNPTGEYAEMKREVEQRFFGQRIIQGDSSFIRVLSRRQVHPLPQPDAPRVTRKPIYSIRFSVPSCIAMMSSRARWRWRLAGMTCLSRSSTSAARRCFLGSSSPNAFERLISMTCASR
ncbi:NAD-dependent epimerase/dehydratase family protein (plasmid) [Dechloromonas sp. ARDL1]|uniref:NAD-dependent epimerase/dehydratase family protein n=1 Tax=Dechloromonas sp. ARDL1 TaxID=3322121 RepID=UPI003DA79492